jgi:hypothetical protein
MRPPFHFIRSRGTDEEAERAVRVRLYMEVALRCHATGRLGRVAKWLGDIHDQWHPCGHAIVTQNVAAQHVKENHCGALPALLWLPERKMCGAPRASFARAAKHQTVKACPNPMGPLYPC